MTEHDKSQEDLVDIYSAADVQEAHLIKGLLAQRDIEAIVLNDTLQSAAGGLSAGSAFSPRVSVARMNEDKARQVLIAYERQREIGPPQVDDILPEDDAESVEWPSCPDCGELRQTVCNVCGVAGTDFPRAEYQVIPMEPPVESAGGACGCGPTGGCGDGEQPAETSAEAEQPLALLLRCEPCDEVFQPNFYRICPWCGHDFGAGIAAPPAPQGEPMNARTKFVLGVFGLGLFALLAYLLWQMAV